MGNKNFWILLHFGEKKVEAMVEDTGASSCSIHQKFLSELIKERPGLKQQLTVESGVVLQVANRQRCCVKIAEEETKGEVFPKQQRGKLDALIVQFPDVLTERLERWEMFPYEIKVEDD
ncbi:hypothetical protein PR048_028641 [Dryococelus australis]|uniref:Uncharacterized protein n=1 Tax=Dryococelus australis TaxID=614101 RepID=A0ABQ9GB52_9NEOP|nr:hypothetical protein PR048_028641 [Dryococelus australis]